MFDGSRVLYQKRFSWEEAIGCMEVNEQVLFNSLPDSIKEEIASKNEKSIIGGLEGGLMSDWDYVMKLSIDNSDIFDVLIGKQVSVSEPSSYDPWMKAFTGKVVENKIDTLVIEDESGKTFEVPIDKLTFICEQDKESTEPSSLPQGPKKMFAVMIAAEYIRDAQAATCSEDEKSDSDSSNWWDFSGAGLLRFFPATSKENAIKLVAEQNGISEDILEAYELAEGALD